MVLGGTKEIVFGQVAPRKKTGRNIFTAAAQKNGAQKEKLFFLLIDQSIQFCVSPPIYLTHSTDADGGGPEKKPWRVRRSESLLRSESGILRVNLINGIKVRGRSRVPISVRSNWRAQSATCENQCRPCGPRIALPQDL